MKISVIIPTYNRAQFVTRAIDSVLQQELKSSEIIVVDDASSDDTDQVLANYKKSIHLLKQATNQGVSAARNRGIQEARYPWLAFLDSDDAWHPKKLAMQATELEKNPQYFICHTNEVWYRNDRRVNEKKKHRKQGGDIFQACLALCAISPSSVLLNKYLLDEVGLFDPSLPACEDYDLWLRISAKYPVLYLDERLTIKYGGHQDQLSQQYWGMDRFRIQALWKLIHSGRLTEQQRLTAIETTLEKIRIYQLGAKKRHKYEEVALYDKRLDQLLTLRAKNTASA